MTDLFSSELLPILHSFFYTHFSICYCALSHPRLSLMSSPTLGNLFGLDDVFKSPFVASRRRQSLLASRKVVVRSVADHRPFPIHSRPCLGPSAAVPSPPRHAHVSTPYRRQSSVTHGVFHNARHMTPAIGASAVSVPLVRVSQRRP
jgi:hypothetical protein